VRLITELRAKHAAGQTTMGIDGNLGKVADMNELGIWEPILVKMQTIKTAVESACMLIRIDDIVSGMPKKQKGGGGPQAQPQMSQEEQDERMAMQQ
jgi:T-complex protein 1 subunit gamma